MVSGKTKVLIVDDDPFILEMVAALLEGEEYSVDTAGNGAEAFTKFCADNGIGILVTDMNMPDMSGLELVGKIRDRGSHVPVIILTGDGDLSIDAAILREKACDILVKDENIQETIGPRIDRALKKYHLKKENMQQKS